MIVVSDEEIDEKSDESMGDLFSNKVSLILFGLLILIRY